MVDMILRIRQKLMGSYENRVPITDDIREMLYEGINDSTRILPDDPKPLSQKS